jgi:hypothetical protein
MRNKARLELLVHRALKKVRIYREGLEGLGFFIEGLHHARQVYGHELIGDGFRREHLQIHIKLIDDLTGIRTLGSDLPGTLVELE